MKKRRSEEDEQGTLLNLRAWSSVRGIPGAGAQDMTLQVLLGALMKSVGANYERANSVVRLVNFPPRFASKLCEWMCAFSSGWRSDTWRDSVAFPLGVHSDEA